MKKISILLISMMLVFTSIIPAFANDNTGQAPSSENACPHYWTEWQTTVDATIHNDGAMTRQCIYCGASDTAPISKLEPYAKFSKKTYKVRRGKSIKLRVKYASGDSVKKWKSSNKKIAKVNKKGKVVGKRKGTAKITVTLQSGKKATCKVKVTKAKKVVVAAKAGGSGTVYWTPSGSVYHTDRDCPTLSRSRTVRSGSISASGKRRMCKVCG